MDAMPKRGAFMTGSGEVVPPERAREFCRSLVDRCLKGNIHGQYDFVLGFAACLDAVLRGTIDFEEHPVNVVMQARADIDNITTAPNKVTNIMKELDR